MIHIVFERPLERLKVFLNDGSLWDSIEASGDAWGDGTSGPYGHDYPIAPGHYCVTAVDPIDPAIVSEGAGQIEVHDIGPATLSLLEGAGKAISAGSNVDIGGIGLPVGGLARYSREGIMIHGGGSNLVEHGLNPLAPDQPLCKTEGCTRVHNADLARLMTLLNEEMSDNTVVYSVIGDPTPLPY